MPDARAERAGCSSSFQCMCAICGSTDVFSNIFVSGNKSFMLSVAFKSKVAAVHSLYLTVFLIISCIHSKIIKFHDYTHEIQLGKAEHDSSCLNAFLV